MTLCSSNRKLNQTQKTMDNKLEARFLTGVIQGLLWKVEWELGLRAGKEALVCTGLNHSEGDLGVYRTINLLWGNNIGNHSGFYITTNMQIHLRGTT